MFVTKTEDDEPFNKLFSKLKKGVKGGGIYIVARGKAQFDQYAGETIVMINDIAEIENRLFVWMRHRKTCGTSLAYTDVGDGRGFLRKRPYQQSDLLGT